MTGGLRGDANCYAQELFETTIAICLSCSPLLQMVEVLHIQMYRVSKKCFTLSYLPSIPHFEEPLCF